ncbi:Hypothetical protein I595_508 [Croceitalea dokdonensis DOKDO 023]|uniref:Uncharacterized protein n=1 Tax=Croceitalea dokdonensis DOKDO 023 TaxID=1300341 RepID=A0A0P7AJ22_9FLAO|nr:Hypothetical protein I595_508 [Croceitalea dokdonensis DOKDO 023]
MMILFFLLSFRDTFLGAVFVPAFDVLLFLAMVVVTKR